MNKKKRTVRRCGVIKSHDDLWPLLKKSGLTFLEGGSRDQYLIPYGGAGTKLPPIHVMVKYGKDEKAIYIASSGIDLLAREVSGSFSQESITKLHWMLATNFRVIAGHYGVSQADGEVRVSTTIALGKGSRVSFDQLKRCINNVAVCAQAYLTRKSTQDWSHFPAESTTGS